MSNYTAKPFTCKGLSTITNHPGFINISIILILKQITLQE